MPWVLVVIIWELKTNVPLSTLSYTNTNRPWQNYHDLAMVLIAHAQQLYGKDDLTETVKVLDSSTIDLCLSLFPWAEFREHKAAIKIHAMLDLEGRLYQRLFTYLTDEPTTSTSWI